MEKWNLYDKNYQMTDKVISSMDDPIDDLYHISTNTFILNSKKQLLLLRKTFNFNLHYPGFWTSLNRNIVEGENAISTIKKAGQSKIGIEIQDDEITSLGYKVRDPYHYIFDVYVVNKEIDLADIKFEDNTIIQAKWVDLKELYNMIENGEIAWVLISRLEEYIIPLMK